MVAALVGCVIIALALGLGLGLGLKPTSKKGETRIAFRFQCQVSGLDPHGTFQPGAFPWLNQGKAPRCFKRSQTVPNGLKLSAEWTRDRRNILVWQHAVELVV